MKNNISGYVNSTTGLTDADAMVSTHVPFRPEQHGFHFINSFNIKTILGRFTLASWKLGLCGGMCAAALHRFNNHLVVPSDKNPPSFNSILYKELFNRQRRSISLSLVVKILKWQVSPDQPRWKAKSGIGYRTKKEWSLLKNLLDEGHPVIIILIRAKGWFQNITKNHQVLATGYNYHPEKGILIIHTYDPNIPGRFNYLTFHIGLFETHLKAYDSYGDHLRGFFVNPLGGNAAV